jgi:Glycosyltransferase family 87
MTQMKKPAVKALFALVVATLLASSIGQRYLGHVMEAPDLDFSVYYLTAQVVHFEPKAELYAGTSDGNPLLRDAPADSALGRQAILNSISATEFYLYPPLLADLIAPFSDLSLPTAAVLWRCFNLGLVLFSTILIAKLLNLRLLSAEFGLLVILAFTFWPVHETIVLGQVAILIMFLNLVCILAYRDGRIVLSAVALALATWLKVTPVLIVPLFFIWRDRKWIAWYIASATALLATVWLVNGWPNLHAYLQLTAAMGAGLPTEQNKNIESIVTWLYYSKLFTLQTVQPILRSAAPVLPALPALINKVLCALVYGLCLVLVWRRRASASLAERLLVIGLIAVVASTLPPVSWRHGYTIAFFPLAYLWVHHLRQPGSRRQIVLLTLTSITLGSLIFDLAARAHLPMFLQIAFASTWTVFSLLLSFDVLRTGLPESTPDPELLTPSSSFLNPTPEPLGIT